MAETQEKCLGDPRSWSPVPKSCWMGDRECGGCFFFFYFVALLKSSGGHLPKICHKNFSFSRICVCPKNQPWVKNNEQHRGIFSFFYLFMHPWEFSESTTCPPKMMVGRCNFVLNWSLFKGHVIML